MAEHPEILNELKMDSDILDKLKADPRFVKLVQEFVTDAAALSVRIANEMADFTIEDESALRWRAEELSAQNFVLLATVLGIAMNDSFYYGYYSAESWGFSADEMMGATAWNSDPTMRVSRDFDVCLSDLEEMMRDESQRLEETIAQM